jgi:twitching motility protein PilT
VELKELLMFMTKKNASDLHLKPMRPPLLRIQGRLIPVKSSPLKPDEVQEMLCSILTPQAAEIFELQHLSVDLGYGIPGVARFRANLYYQRGTIAGSLPPRALRHPERRRAQPAGRDRNLHRLSPAVMVLVTGPTGSGKSTTLAALRPEDHEEPVVPHRHHRGSRSSSSSPTTRPRSRSARWERTPRPSRRP